MKFIHLLYISFFWISFIVLVASFVSAECSFWVYSSDILPVENVLVDVRDLSDNVSLWMNYTGVSGFVVCPVDCNNTSVKVVYPSSGYSALLSNASVGSSAHINGWVTAQVQLKNTLGSYLEGQDCSVVIYGANTSILIHDYDTACHTGDSYIDKDGNWVSVADCKLTDSQGWYYFKGGLGEDLGFEYNRFYDLVFTCNGKTKTVSFKTVLEKAPDMVKVEDYIQRYGGILFIYFILTVGLVLFCVFILILLIRYKSKARN